MAIKIQFAVTATRCAAPHASRARYEDRSWSVRKRIDIVRRNMCPETSCPLRRRGTARKSETGKSEAMPANSDGCVAGDIVDLVKQNSVGTDIKSPSGMFS